MFGKLIKYELRSVGKWYLGLYAITIVFAILLGLITGRFSQVQGMNSPHALLEIVLPVLYLAFIALIAALFICTLILTTRRFYNNIYGRQGYLILTLPVSNHLLILSKLFSALIWYFLAFITTALSCFFIIATIGLSNYDFRIILQAIFDTLHYLDMSPLLDYLTAGILYLLNQFISWINSILLIYFAISVGQLFKNHRVLMAFVTYLCIIWVFGFLFLFVGLTSTSFYNNFQPTEYLLFDLMKNIVLCLLYYFGTYYIMNKKVNLQ